MRFTSRGPRNLQEIAACVSLYKHSPFWTKSSISEADIVACWKDLLTSGIGLIDIIENSGFAKDLINSDRAVVDPHYRYGFFYVAFVAYIRFEVARELLNRKDDSVDALLYFLQLYNTYRLDGSAFRPTPKISKEEKTKGKLGDDKLYLFSCGIYHPEASLHFSLQTFRYVFAKDFFADRALSDIRKGHIGFRHDAFIHAGVGAYLIIPYASVKLRRVFDYSGNAKEPFARKKYLFCVLRDDDVSEQLGLLKRYRVKRGLGTNRYSFLFFSNSVKEKPKLTRLQQNICYLRMVGFSHEQIGAFLDPKDYKRIMAIKDPQVKKTTRERLRKKIAFQQNQASLILRKKELMDAPTEGEIGRDQLVAALEDAETAHEIREYMFSVYPWPKDLDSRP